MSSTDAATAAHPQRLFVALDVPKDVRDLVHDAVEPVRARYPSARWVPEQNQHVTVKFLGSTPPDLVDPVLERVGDVATADAPFTWRVATVGAFPSARRARVLWVGLDDPEERGATIAAALDDALAPGFERERRAFIPHLTVARFDPPVRLEDAVTELGVESRVFQVDALTVYRSHLGRPGPRYEVVASFPLGRRSPLAGR